ncbi:MAG TPA: histidinol-phosphatase [Gemmatimonadaceae bacterium]|nr:histidinol-phosphatase [Gemmatimonadaceae bacterium]
MIGPPSYSPADGALLLEAAEQLARVTGAIALRYFRAALTVEWKADGSPVTMADRAAESEARAWLARRFPEDGVLGEEMGVSLPGAKRQWIIDPIDGTRTFLRGVPLWGTLVAVAEGEAVLAGAACFPAVDELLVASRTLGCWWNGARARVSSVDTITRATALTTDERFVRQPTQRRGWRRLARTAGMSRSWGDCYGYLLVATGRAEVMVDPIMSPWDAAALLPIIDEAGGVFTDWSGVVTAFGGSAVATNRALADEARALLGVPASAGVAAPPRGSRGP